MRNDDGTRGNPPPRRAFLGSAFVSLGSLLGATLAGCQSQRPSNLTDNEEAELQSLRKVDPKLIGYTELAAVSTNMQAPRGVAAAPDESIWVVGDKVARKFDPSGRQTAEIALPDEPTCIALDSDGSLLVGLTDRVGIFSAEGALTSEWPRMGTRAIVTAIAPDGPDVWVANAGERVVAKCSREGEVVLELGKKDPQSNYPGLVLPSPHLDVAVTSSGDVLITNPGVHQIERWTKDGKRLAAWGTPSEKLDGFCGCCNPTDMALLPDGRVVTSEKGIPRVKVYTPDGEFETVVAAPDQFAPNTLTLDLATTRAGDVLVVDTRAGTVRRFRSKA